ncbi:hypothetical protein SmJEL517_g06109 [Synchytrium microbalum]|uniref:ATP-binding cassette sub-family B member 6 n=1 Tax=Synchytrium microbalum TaxID=1806994 RepID=A0A507BSF0_9FUNG|nr:uncharacterized protein SmJEL517_g06109 [Synchytrium microbalum]TPX30291.1 hypothetical protein SmJEL517_g06109 [Synchytrium microbalum]
MSLLDSNFCAPPYLDGNVLSVCLVNVVETSTLLIVSLVVTLVWYYSFRKSQNALSAERQPLLNGDDAHISLPAQQSHTSFFLLLATKIFSSLILVTCLIDLGIDLYHATHPDLPANVVQQPSEAAADLLMSFAWLISTTLLFFLSALVTDGVPSARDLRPLPSGLIVYYVIALLAETLPLYNWIILWLQRNSLVGLDYVFMGVFAARYVFIVGILLASVSHSVSEARTRRRQRDAEANAQGNSTTPKTGWADVLKKIQKLFPFLWPDSLYLQLMVLSCFLLLGLGRVVNVLVPFNYKAVVDALTPGGSDEAGDKTPYFAWGLILVFVGLRFLQGGVGVLSSLQSYLWIPVAQYTTRKISVKMLDHLHSLSLQYHLNRKTGELLRIMDRGVNSIGSLLSYLLFNIVPVFVDILVAVIFFIWQFGFWFGAIVFVTMTLYIVFTIAITEWRAKFRREMIELDNASRTRAVDSLLNYETVKYYGAEKREVALFDEAMIKFMKADFVSSASLNILNTAQNLIITLGLLVGCLLCAKEVADGLLSTGDFVMFLTYITQLYVPLNWFGTYYRVIQQNFIDMEKMLELFEENASVQDTLGATPLQIRGGAKVVFENVSFSYDPRQPVIRGISFEVPSGKTVAIVGPTGAGKSSLLRLLFRFYDTTEGRITIDGQDIRNVTQTSLRQAIGVVPQDSVLFNNTIKYNIEYGRPTASEAEVEQAAQAAQIHEKIQGFVDGYNTKVGERGLRLSGGEKQRVAIARTILKNPAITLVIAHRLSTIVDADEILVLKEGRIVERGTHQQLLARGEARLARLASSKAAADKVPASEYEGEGTYFEMWTKQLESERAINDSTGAEGLVHRPVATFNSGGKPPAKPAAGRGNGSDANYHSTGGSGGGAFH